MTKMESQETINALMAQKLTNIDKSITEINDKLDNKYVTKDEFWVVKTIVYSGVGIVLSAVATALVYLVLKR